MLNCLFQPITNRPKPSHVHRQYRIKSKTSFTFLRATINVISASNLNKTISKNYGMSSGLNKECPKCYIMFKNLLHVFFYDHGRRNFMT